MSSETKKLPVPFTIPPTTFTSAAKQKWHCPFCQKSCPVGLDCTCGAQAVNSELWFNCRPLMARPGADDMLIVVALANRRLDADLREMIEEEPA